MNWLAADALNPSTYVELLPGSTAVVHTLGTLLEDTNYKTALKEGDPLGMLRSFLESVSGGGGNPLTEGPKRKGSYESLNRDAGMFLIHLVYSRCSRTMFVFSSTHGLQGFL